MGGLVQLLPFTYSMMLIGSMSLVALPFLTGFYSKDLIIECAGSTYVFHGSKYVLFFPLLSFGSERSRMIDRGLNCSRVYCKVKKK